MNKKTILVSFGGKLSSGHFDKVLAGKELEEFWDTGSVREAYGLVNKLSLLTLPDGSRISGLIQYNGYELWWMNYDNLCHQFCFPYTQYRRLLEYLKTFDEIYLYRAPNPYLFHYFLTAHHRKCIEIIGLGKKIRRYLLPAGICLQLVLSALFLIPLMISRPKIMFWTNDIFTKPYKGDFRHRFFYRAFKEHNISFAHFIRSTEPWRGVLKNVFLRKRPVIYVAAIIEAIHSRVGLFEKKEHKDLVASIQNNGSGSDERFLFLIAGHYLKDNIRATCWSIEVIKLILKLIGVKSAVIVSAASRTFHTVLACKMAGIKTVGVQHGVAPRYFLVADFMPEFNGKKRLTLDAYGLWSEWWRDYYLKYSRAYGPEQIFVSGPIRPSEKKDECAEPARPNDRPLKVLFISEEVADPKEVIVYLSAILEVKDFDVSIKFRPQLDGFEEWLKKNRPDIFTRVKAFKGDIHEAAGKSDILVGSYSTAVLEGLAELKPFVLFMTKKWGDYFDIKSFPDKHYLLADNPKDFIMKIRENANLPADELKKLQKQFLGDPRRNGSQWVIETAIKFSNSSEKP